MSFDPSGYTPDQPSRPPRREAQGQDWDEQGWYPEDSPEERARAKTNVPGILLIVLACLNLLGVLWFVVEGIVGLSMSPKDYAETQERVGQAFPGLQQGQQQQQSPEQMKIMKVTINFGGAALWLALSIVTMLAGIRMRQLRSYGLAITGAIITALPCVSPMACCGFGEVVGIWALIVLVSPEVKAFFK